MDDASTERRQAATAMRIRTKRRLGSVLAVSSFAAGALAIGAFATPPGTNGGIAFKRYFDTSHSRAAIFRIEPSGSGEQAVTQAAAGVADDQPDWSRDGSLIAFTRCAPASPCAIYTVRPDGSSLTRISPACTASGPNIETKCEDGANVSFLPDGQHVVYTRSTGKVRTFPDWEQIQHSDIVVRDLSGHGLRVLLRSPPYAGDYTSPQFSPNGSRFVYVRANSPLSRPKLRHAIFVADASGKSQQRVTPWSLDAGDNPDWSPDGRLILFRSHESDDGTQSQIYVVKQDGSGLQALTHFPTGTTVLSYSFSPDGKSITFARSGVGGEPDIFTMRANGTNIQPVTRNRAWDSAPDWGPTG